VEAALLHPEAGGGAVEEADQSEMMVLGSLNRELNYGRCLLKDLAATVKDEMVVRRDFRESDRQRGPVPIDRNLVIFPVWPTNGGVGSLAEVQASGKDPAKGPKPTGNVALLTKCDLIRIWE
jgi:hypothetical protein